MIVGRGDWSNAQRCLLLARVVCPRRRGRRRPIRIRRTWSSGAPVAVIEERSDCGGFQDALVFAWLARSGSGGTPAAESPHLAVWLAPRAGGDKSPGADILGPSQCARLCARCTSRCCGSSNFRVKFNAGASAKIRGIILDCETLPSGAWLLQPLVHVRLF